MSKRGLGKGLQALIPEVDLGDRESVQELLLDRIDANPDQPRKEFSPEKLAELADSIREHGVVQPIIVRPRGDRYEIVAGERRWRAAKLAGLEKIPALAREFTEQKLMEIALIENLQRADLNPLEEAEAYRRLIDRHGLTQEDLAKRLGKSRPQISNTLRLLTLDPAVREEVGAGRISMGHAKVLLTVAAPNTQRAVSQWVVDQKLSVRELEEVLQRGNGNPSEADLRAVLQRSGKGPDLPKEPKPKGNPAKRNPDLLDLEDRLRQLFGTPVKVQPGSPRGKIEISFYGNDDLRRLVDLLTGRAGAEETRTRPAPFRV